MSNKGLKIALWITLSLVVLAGLVTIALLWFPHRKPITLKGAVLVRDSDTRKQLPIADVEVAATSGLTISRTKSDSSGLFSVALPVTIRRGQQVTFEFRNPRYRPLNLDEFVGDQLYVARMVPLTQQNHVASNQPATPVGNLRVRYSIKTMTALNVGSAVQPFQVENKGNVPCNGHDPCSPDGKWKAALGSVSLDAGSGNEFRNVRASCIAGPCPFTRIESEMPNGGIQNLKVTARDWSDTATFLVEAEVFHPMVSQLVHQSYPVIFGRALNFTLPTDAEGVSIAADLDGQTIIFPLGPALFLRWATCDARTNPDKTRVYRCELKPGYRFQ